MAPGCHKIILLGDFVTKGTAHRYYFDSMNKPSLESTIRVFAGVFILLSLGLAHYVSPYWYFFTAFVGVNLIQSAFSKWCLLETILKKTLYKEAI